MERDLPLAVAGSRIRWTPASIADAVVGVCPQFVAQADTRRGHSRATSHLVTVPPGGHAASLL